MARALFPVTVVYLAANASLSAVLIAFGIRRLGGSELWREAWPKADPRFLVTDSVTVVVQVNGKLRGKFEAPLGLAREALIEHAEALENVRSHLATAEVVKVSWDGTQGLLTFAPDSAGRSAPAGGSTTSYPFAAGVQR